MARPYSEDLRIRLVKVVENGHATRSRRNCLRGELEEIRAKLRECGVKVSVGT